METDSCPEMSGAVLQRQPVHLDLADKQTGRAFRTHRQPDRERVTAPAVWKGGTMSGILDGRIAVITGGSMGIGLATAARFLAEGASVVIAGRRRTELDNAVANLGGDVTGVQADVSD